VLVAAAAEKGESSSSESTAPSEGLLSGYHNNKKLYFKPTESSTFQLVKLGNVNVTFLDKTNLLGYDGQDMAKVCSRPSIAVHAGGVLPAVTTCELAHRRQ